MSKYTVGQKVYLIESTWISEAVIESINGPFYVVKFTDRDGAIRVRESRLFESEHEAKKSLRNKR